jgi:uncharacterized protein YndB with AHSA1/START domain
MARITVSIELPATPARVWEVVEPIEEHTQWMADAVAIRFVNEQRRGVGTKFLCDTKVGPIRLTDHMEITAWEPERLMGVTHTGVVTGTGQFTIEPATTAGHSNFTWSEELHFPWWLGGAIGEVIGGSLVMKTIWRRNLKKLRALFL